MIGVVDRKVEADYSNFQSNSS